MLSSARAARSFATVSGAMPLVVEGMGTARRPKPTGAAGAGAEPNPSGRRKVAPTSVFCSSARLLKAFRPRSIKIDENPMILAPYEHTSDAIA